MYYKIIITETGKAPRSKGAFDTFNIHAENMPDLVAVKEYLAERYPKGTRRMPIFVDKKDGSTERVGYIYRFRNRDISHNSEEWIQEDWVAVREVEEKTVLV